METQSHFQKPESDRFQMGGSRVFWLIAGFGVGLTAMYYADPNRSAYRRHVLRDRLIRLTNRTEDLALRGARDIGNRLRGVWYRFQHPLNKDVDDEILLSRVRSEFGKKVSHAKSITTEVHGGVVTLSGPILSSEVRQLVRCVRSVPGVKSLVNRLDVRKNAAHISGLQGQGKEYLQ